MLLPKRITVFAPDIPYPAHRGGRADVWRRVVALQSIGIEVQLVCYYDDLPHARPTPDDVAVIESTVSQFILFPIPKGFRPLLQRLPRLARMPWHAACRALTDLQRDDLTERIRGFKSEMIWCDGPVSSVPARQAADTLDLPFAYRSHNIEHLYMARQAVAARRLRDRMAWSLVCIGLKAFEEALVERADWVFDISSDDMAFWQGRGVQHISWLPPLAESALKQRVPSADPPINDVVFLGNLKTPNNVRGVEWLIQEIRPLVLARRPGTRFVVAGSNPGEYVRSLCETAGVTLLADVPDALRLYASARVLVNPVRTGSGTHVKAIEMLMMDAPIVSSAQGTQGFPAELKHLFRVADTAEAFALEIIDALRLPADLSTQRAIARRMFGVDGLTSALAAFWQRFAGRSRSPAS